MSKLDDYRESGVDFNGLSLNMIQGIPCRFPNSADTHISNLNAGTSWLDTMFTDANLVTLLPGQPKLNPRAISIYASSSGDELDPKDAASAVGKLESDIFYTFEASTEPYWESVALIISAMAELLDVTDYVKERFNVTGGLGNGITGSQVAKALTSDFLASLSPDAVNSGGDSYNTPVTFYNDGEITVSESFSNSTTESILSTLSRPQNSVLKELNTLTSSFTDNVNDNTSGGKGFFGSKLKFLQSNKGLGVISGQRQILFPKIWDTSTFVKPISLQFKFDTPYGAPESVMDRILIPYACLLPFIQGRHIGGSSFLSPYLLKMFSRGTTNVMMGIVTSAVVTKVQSSRTNGGLPTELTVQLNIDDLYTGLPIPYQGTANAYQSNELFMNYLAALTGYNYSKASVLSAVLERKVNTIIQDVSNALTNTTKVFGRAKHRLRTKLTTWGR